MLSVMLPDPQITQTAAPPDSSAQQGPAPPFFDLQAMTTTDDRMMLDDCVRQRSAKSKQKHMEQVTLRE
jgi:hypothetical protein